MIWIILLKGQPIPRGLHVRINLATGEKEAKLLEDDADNSKTSALLNVETNNSPETEKPDISETKLDQDELKLALKKIKNLAPESDLVGKKFRTFEEIKKEMDEIQQTIKTESEIVKDLVTSFTSMKKNSEIVKLLEDLEYYAHKFDNALDFIKMGGFKNIVVPALNSTEGDIRSAAALLLGI